MHEQGKEMKNGLLNFMWVVLDKILYVAHKNINFFGFRLFEGLNFFGIPQN